MKFSLKTKPVIIGLVVLAIVLLSSVMFLYKSAPTNNRTSTIASATLPVIVPKELARHDGTDPGLPIYIGLDGYVYDVTAGKQFYIPGGSYHNLAGKDSTQQLKFFGGDIIKQKYPIIGTLRQ